MDSPSCAGVAIAGAGNRGGISERRRAGHADIQHQLRTATTIDSVIRATATAAVAPAPAAIVTATSELTDAFRRHPAATAHGAAADIRPYALEDCETKRPGAYSLRRAPVDDEQKCAAVDGDDEWSRLRW